MSEVFGANGEEGRVSEVFFFGNSGNQSWEVWVRLRGKTKMAESKMAKLKMAAIIKLSENEGVWVRLNEFESEFCSRWLNPRWWNSSWQNSRWLPSSSWVRMNERSFFLCKMAESKMARIQDGCHHQVEWEWMSLSQIEGVWVRVLFKMAESKIAEFKMAAIIKLVRLNEWSIFSKWWRGKSEWSFFFFGNGGNQSWQVWVSLRGKTKMAESKNG